jgi:hypothetical protein
MIARILRTELRRSIAVILGLVTIVSLLVLLHMSNSPALKDMSGWTRQWDSMARWERYWLIEVCAVVLGLGALQGRADHRAKMDELLSTTARPGWRRVGPKVAAAAIVLAVAYLLVLGACAVQVAGNATYNDLAWLPVTLVGLLAVITSAVLGMGIGRLLPSLLTAPILAIVGLFGLASSSGNSGSNETLALLAPELRQPTNAFTTVAASVHLGQAGWFLGLAITGYLLFVVRQWRARVRAFLPAVLGLLTALLILPGTEAAAYPVNRTASALVCTTDAPKVCVTTVNATELPYLAGPARQALAALSTLPNAPTEAIESDPASTEDPERSEYGSASAPAPVNRSAGVLVVDFNEWALDDYTAANALQHNPDRLLSGLLAGAGTQACPSPSWAQATRQDTARAIATAWATGALPTNSESTQATDQAWQQFRALPSAVQRQRITAFRAATMTCHGDLLAILTAGPAS